MEEYIMQITKQKAVEIVDTHFGDFMQKLTMNGFEVCRECGGSGRLTTSIDAGDKRGMIGSTYCHVCQTGGPYWSYDDHVRLCMSSCGCSEDEAKEIIRRGELTTFERDAEDAL